MYTAECGRAELIPTRETLLSRLRDWSDQESWREFFSLYHSVIYREARRRGLTDTEAKDVVQETMISVAKAMPGFRYRKERGSFKGWLLNLTRWRINDCLRRRLRINKPIGECGALAAESGSDGRPEPAVDETAAMWEAEWREALLHEAIRRVKVRVHPKNYQLFDLCVLKGWSSVKAAQLLGVSRARVYLAKQRITRMLRHEIRQLAMEAN